MSEDERDSKKLWLGLRGSLPVYDVRLGRATAQDYVHDPRHIAFVAGRYKFVSKMFAGLGEALEVGCGDAFGAPLVAQSVARLLCTDIDEEVLAENRERCRHFGNLAFAYHDFRAAPHEHRFDGVYLVDVLEHLYPEEEAGFVANLCASLAPHGILLIGTPNAAASAHASEHSQTGHVNLKTHQALRELGLRHFHNVFLFSMNDELVHTGYFPMAHYLWALCATRRDQPVA